MEANLSETPNLLLVTPTVSRRTFDGIRVGKSVNAATGQIIFLEGAAEGSAIGFDPEGCPHIFASGSCARLDMSFFLTDEYATGSL